MLLSYLRNYPVMPQKVVTNIFILICFGALAYLIFWSPSWISISGSSKTNVQSLEEQYVSYSFRELMKGPILLSQDNEFLIQEIRTKYLFPPSLLPYNLVENDGDPSRGQSNAIRQILGNKTGGFFVECGALDGETRSNSLLFEKVDGWKGILIEGDPKNYALMREKHRKAWTVPACLSTKPYPMEVLFHQQFNIGKISNLDTSLERSGYAKVQCLPLYSILLAVNVTAIDYFSLDIEGVEMDVLRTIPWERVNISTLSVEFVHDTVGMKGILNYMERRGYKLYSVVRFPGGLANDLILYNPKLVTPEVLPENIQQQIA